LKLLQNVKEHLVTAHIPMIMLTAKASQEAKELGLQTGADAYLTKPFHVEELNMVVKNIFSQQQKLQKHLKEQWVNPIEPVQSTLQDTFLTQLNTYIIDHISDTNLGVNDLAEAMKISKSTLNRKLKAVLDLAASDYIKHVRLRHSLAYFLQHKTVGEIAFAVGFESNSYFTQCFKEFYGKTPSAYKKSIK
jgi:AraC-like DNA-binding protein